VDELNQISAICKDQIVVDFSQQDSILLRPLHFNQTTLSLCGMELDYGIRTYPLSNYIEETNLPVYEIDEDKYYSRQWVFPETDSVELVVFHEEDYSVCRTGIAVQNIGSISNGQSEMVERTNQVSASLIDTENNEFKGKSDFQATVYPNPFQSSFTIELGTDSEDLISIDVYSISGINVYSKKQRLNSGNNRFIVKDFESCHSEIYMMVIVGENINYTQKLIKSN